MTRDTKRLQLLELPCEILCFSIEDDYQRNIYVTNSMSVSKQNLADTRKKSKLVANAIFSFEALLDFCFVRIESYFFV